jgi:hypothetical protein
MLSRRRNLEFRVKHINRNGYIFKLADGKLPNYRIDQPQWGQRSTSAATVSRQAMHSMVFSLGATN